MNLKSIAWRHSLRGRLIVVLLAVGLIPLAIAVFIAFRTHERTFVDHSGAALIEVSYNFTEIVDRMMFERWGDAQAFPHTVLVQSMEAEPLRGRLTELVEIYNPNYALIAVADPSGNIVAASRGSEVHGERIEGTNVSGESWFRKAIGGQIAAKQPLFEDVHQDSLLRNAVGDEGRAWAVTFTAPIERDGRIVGVLHLVCNWAAVQQLAEDAVAYERKTGAPSTRLLLLNREGAIVYSDNAAQFMRTTFSDHEIVDRVRRSDVRGSSRTRGLGSDEELIAGYARSRGAGDFPGLGWTAIATESVSEARKSAWSVIRNSIVVAAVVALAVVFVAIFFANYLTRPLAMMAGTLHNLATAEADLSRRLPAQRSDELGFVSRSFNTFVDNLQRMIDQVIRSGMQVTMSTTQIAAGSRQLEASVAEQVAATNEVVATTNEIAATANDLSFTMSAVARMSEDTAHAAAQGQRDLHQMAESVLRMEEATQAVSARLAVINDKAGNISTVVTTITKVADQTNLLSLNAAIEAEKAGQFGQGFAVVAREIRRLADQTAVATLDIEKMVKEMKSAVSSGVMSMEKLNEQVRNSVDTVRQVGAQLETIVGKIQEVAPKFEAAHVGMQMQFQGAQQISQAMGQLSETTQQTALALREANRAIVELNDAAGSLQTMFSRFKLTEAAG
ncbi:MAG TPA: methyl-accepting chemotaxis protein [Thermoanaerobaculia bacterium]|nr:methyl-accepting chemotaxis protein [Thermoanaerobaculia bacterium]